ncbi:MAG: hypothetical protein V5A34_00610 [Halapricum sp.]
MHKRELANHNDKYVIFFEFDDESDSLATVDDPVAEKRNEQPIVEE